MTESRERPHLTVEDMPARRREIGTLREQSGKEQEALDLIWATRADAGMLGLHEDVVDLYWEEFLVGRHLNDLEMMRISAQNADDYIERFNVESKRPRSNRFVGIVLLEDEHYAVAADTFREGISLFEQMSDPVKRANALELRGYLAETLIWEGKVSDGIGVGVGAFNAFETGDGAELKGLDHYTLAVWKSGVAIKMWDAVLGGNATITAEERQKLVQVLDEAEEAINTTPTEAIWGDFTIRRDQIAKIRHQIANR